MLVLLRDYLINMPINFSDNVRTTCPLTAMMALELIDDTAIFRCSFLINYHNKTL